MMTGNPVIEIILAAVAYTVVVAFPIGCLIGKSIKRGRTGCE